jgi:hypothetical protein
MYHSVATLLPNGTVLVTGSNPQGNVEIGTKYPTEYRIEIFTPPELQLNKPQPIITTIGGNALNSIKHLFTYTQSIEVKINLSVTGFQQPLLQAALIRFGFVTHSQSMSQRYVELAITSVVAPIDATSTEYTLTISAPSDATLLPPGPCFLTILYDGTTCQFMAAATLQRAV